MKRTLLLLALGATVASAQPPNVSFRSEILGSWQLAQRNDSRIRWYSPKGEYSTVGLRVMLEPGLRVTVNQRLQRVDNDADQDALDEYYIEDVGQWRVGKQYLPFGLRNVMRESVPGARFNTSLLFSGLPIAIAVCDAGSGRTRGVAGRVGRDLGLSFAVGDHFGIAATSMTQFRRPEESPGVGRGHHLALGADFALPIGATRLQGELVCLRDGKTPDDPDMDLTDIQFRFPESAKGARLSVAWSRSWGEGRDFYRIEGVAPYNRKLSYETYIRFEGAQWHDFGLTARVRL